MFLEHLKVSELKGSFLLRMCQTSQLNHVRNEISFQLFIRLTTPHTQFINAFYQIRWDRYSKLNKGHMLLSAVGICGFLHGLILGCPPFAYRIVWFVTDKSCLEVYCGQLGGLEFDHIPLWETIPK